MCDYSITHMKSRPAKVGDKLTTRDFGTGTRGFCAFDGPGNENIAVCLLPGTEIAFDEPIRHIVDRLSSLVRAEKQKHSVAIFRQINKDKIAAHHDALELPDGKTLLLTLLSEGQTATVLQLPAIPKNEAEVEAQRRVKAVG